MKARGKTAIVIAAAGLMLALPGAARAAVAVSANGNAFTGGLSFAPGAISARVGEQISWTNTDFLAPHTVTETHGLFDLVGNNVNGTPISPSGFGPGSSVMRSIEAGTIHYYCRVHPQPMQGVIAVPVTLSVSSVGSAALRSTAVETKRRKRKHSKKKHRKHKPAPPAAAATVTATWAPAPPASGTSFDVQVKQGEGPWQSLADNTTAASTSFPGGPPGTAWTVRARWRSATDPSKATDWSPDASVSS